VALEHIILNVGLCKAIARLAPQANIAMRVVVTDKVDRVQMNKVLTFQRGTGDRGRVDFDSSWGTYKIAMSVPRYNCNGIDYIEIMPDHDRSLNTQLVDGPPGNIAPAIVFGTLPQSFAYAKPAVVIFPATLRCNAEVPEPQTDGIDNEVEQDAYYTAIRTPALYHQPVAVTLAVRLQTASGGYHYIKMPWRFASGYSWPSLGSLNIDDGLLDWAAEQTEDVLLCPRYYGTSVDG
jgi:hypothetical protein